MKFVDEYRDAGAVLGLARAWRTSPPVPGRSWRSAAVRPTPSFASASTRCCLRGCTLVHGPGCPVCVTPVELIDRALAIAAARRRSCARSATWFACPAARRTCSPPRPKGATCGSSTRRSTRSPWRAGPGTAGRVLRGGLRDHGPRHRPGRLPGEAARGPQLLAPRLARPGAAGDARHPALAGQPRPGVPGRRSRVCRDGHLPGTSRSRASTRCRSS